MLFLQKFWEVSKSHEQDLGTRHDATCSKYCRLYHLQQFCVLCSCLQELLMRWFGKSCVLLFASLASRTE